MAVNARGATLAIADDGGSVHVVDAATHVLQKVLRGAHAGSLCSAVAFRPRRPWELLSGGLDARLARWDFARGGRPLAEWAMGGQAEWDGCSGGGDGGEGGGNDDSAAAASPSEGEGALLGAGSGVGSARDSCGVASSSSSSPAAASPWPPSSARPKMCNPPMVHAVAVPSQGWDGGRASALVRPVGGLPRPELGERAAVPRSALIAALLFCP